MHPAARTIVLRPYSTRTHFRQRPAVQQKATIGQAGADLSSWCNSSEKAVMAILSELVARRRESTHPDATAQRSGQIKSGAMRFYARFLATDLGWRFRWCGLDQPTGQLGAGDVAVQEQHIGPERTHTTPP